MSTVLTHGLRNQTRILSTAYMFQMLDAIIYKRIQVSAKCHPRNLSLRKEKCNNVIVIFQTPQRHRGSQI